MRPMLLLAAALALAACTETGGPFDSGGPPIGGQAAGLRVTATSEGPDIDPDGYRVTVDGDDRGALPANGSATIELAPGRHTIALGDMASNCVVDGLSTRTLEFGAGEVVQLAFLVSCTGAMPNPSPVSDLAFVSGADIYVARADGSNVRRLTTEGYDRPHYSPVWSPDGSRLAFMRYESSGRFAIWAMNANGSGAVRLSRGDVDDFRPRSAPRTSSRWPNSTGCGPPA